MRIHLGHHFYGAGNLGDDFMLAGFLAALRVSAPEARLTCCVPFAREPLARRFPEIEWLAYDETTRTRAWEECDVWLGLGGSPFQSAQSRWFVDHLVEEAAGCERYERPMFFLGVGVQTATELENREVQRVCGKAAGIWTRDEASAERIGAMAAAPPVAAAADLAHIYFRGTRPPAAAKGRLTLVANFDYGSWESQGAGLRALEGMAATEWVWLAQETRELAGAERALWGGLTVAEQKRWRLVVPERAGEALPEVMAGWPSGEWLVTARYHAAIAGAWAGSKIVILATNEKLRGVAKELGVALVDLRAEGSSLAAAVAAAEIVGKPQARAEVAQAAVAAFVQASGRYV